MNIRLNQSKRHIPMSETILETIRTLNIQAQKYIESQKEVAYSYSLDAKNLATSYLSQLGSNSEIPLSPSINDESFIISVKKELVFSISNIVHIFIVSKEYVKAFEAIEEGLPIAKECSLNYAIAQFLLNSGNCFFEKNEIFKALESYEESLDILKYHTDLESGILTSKVLNNIGNVYFRLKEPSLSLKFYFQSLELKNSLSLPDNQFGMTYLNIGAAYSSIDNLQLAFENYEKALSVSKKNNDLLCLGLCLNNIGNYWLGLNDFDKAIESFEESIEVKKSLHLDSGLETSYYNVAILLAKKSRFQESTNYLEDALELAKKYSNSLLLADIYILFADLNSTIENPLRSLDFAKECLKTIETIPNILENDQVRSEILRISSTIEELKGNYSTSLELFKQYKRIEQQTEKKHFDIQEMLLREQTEFERRKNIEKNDSDSSFQLEELRIENAIVSDILQRTKENLNILLEQKNDLIRMASHDLKNPLNNILGFAEYLLKEIPSIPFDEIKEYASYIRDSAHRMTNIVTTILDVNKLGTSSISVSLQKTNVASIVNTMFLEYSNYASTKNITLSKNILTQKSVCETDPDLLKQIIDNIFSNAIKYSPLGSKVQITLRSQDNIVSVNEEQKIENVLIVEIEDKGPGFTEDDRINMFGTYAKLSAKPTAGEHSSGLGLSIVKKLSELINVSVWCESTIGDGSTFFIEVPEIHSQSNKNNGTR